MADVLRCDLCGSRLLAERMRWCPTCRRSWVHLSCAKQNGGRCSVGHDGLRFVQRNKRRRTAVVEVEAGVAEVPVQMVFDGFGS